MWCPALFVLAIGLMSSIPQQYQLSESQAVTYIQRISVSKLDADLPDVPFGAWLADAVGSSAGVTWQLTDCGDPNRLQSEGDIPGCVEVTAMLPNFRKVVVVTAVGTFRKGIIGSPKLNFTVIEDDGKFYNVPGLSDLPEMVRMNVIKERVRPVKLPAVALNRYPVFFHNINGSTEPLKLLDGRKAFEPDLIAPLSEAPRKVSEGILIGSALTRIIPVYPPIAKSNRITGEVKVEVTISEDGRVIDALAISGPPMLRYAAEDAARRWIFKPTVFNGVPVRIQGVLTFVFTQP